MYSVTPYLVFKSSYLRKSLSKTWRLWLESWSWTFITQDRDIYIAEMCFLHTALSCMSSASHGQVVSGIWMLGHINGMTPNDNVPSIKLSRPLATDDLLFLWLIPCPPPTSSLRTWAAWSWKSKLLLNKWVLRHRTPSIHHPTNACLLSLRRMMRIYIISSSAWSTISKTWGKWRNHVRPMCSANSIRP